MYTRLRLLLVVFVALVAPSFGGAQQTSTRAASAGGPRLEMTRSGVRQPRQFADSAAVVLAQRKSMGKPIALMVAGGAAVVLGAIIGGTPGTLFMIGGAVALIYGLYLYLQ